MECANDLLNKVTFIVYAATIRIPTLTTQHGMETRRNNSELKFHKNNLFRTFTDARTIANRNAAAEYFTGLIKRFIMIIMISH